MDGTRTQGTQRIRRPLQNIPIANYSNSLETMGVPADVIKYLEGAMDDYRHGLMAGMNDNVERLSG